MDAARRLKAKGYEWAALILDDSGADEDGALTGEYNRQVYPEFVLTFRTEGLKAGCWFTQGGNIYQAPADSDLAIAECEGPGDYDGIEYAINQGWMPDVPLGLVTNFSTIDRPRARVLIDAGFTCLPEAYMNENPSQTPDSMDRVARNLGWATSQPVAGVYPYQGQAPPVYEQAESWPLADYLGEYVI